MDHFSILVIFPIAFALVGSVGIVYQVYKMTLIDAKARGFKHPKLLGLLTAGGKNSSGIFLYLIGRRKYPIIHLSEYDQKEIERCKKKIGVGLVFTAVSAIALVVLTFFFRK